MKDITASKNQLEDDLKHGILISFLIIIAIFFVTLGFGIYYAKKIADSIDIPLEVFSLIYISYNNYINIASHLHSANS